jgi:DNA repair exonuclease SbcCD ATPase subunit
MRLRSISISGFRGFSARQELDLEGDAVILVGANGSGKTSFFDAILWALAGRVPRLGEGSELVVSEYSPTGEALVELGLSEPDGSQMTVTRRFDGEMNVLLESGDEPALRGPAAEARLLEKLWPDARLASDPWDALSRALTRGVYLQQDLLREFIEADSEQERFTVIGEIVGVGRVGELQRQLESGKSGWTRSTTMLNSELEPLRQRRTALAQRLDRLTESTADSSHLIDDWNAWLQRARAFIELPELAADSPEVGRVLDTALKELEALQLQTQRRTTLVDQLFRHLTLPMPDEQKLEPLRRTVAEAEQVATDARSRLKTAQEQAAAERSRQVALREQTQELRALAELALRHLDERCPVCEQTYDVEATRERLEATVAADKATTETIVSVAGVEAVAAELEAAERTLADATARLGDAEKKNAMREDWLNQRRALVHNLELREGDDGLQGTAIALRTSLGERLDQLQVLRREGEALSLRLARSGEIAQRAELERELAALESELSAREAELAARAATGEVAGEILNVLRDASSEIVGVELARIEPLLQRIYATVNPHPAFRAVRLLTRTVRGRGRLWTSLEDHTAKIHVQEPRTVLSSSQLNVLAVSVFLALNLGVESLPLDVVALDDPLQSLDDVNLLGLIDLLRRIKGRQIVISTHDARFGSLLGRKLRTVSDEQRAWQIQIEGWTRDGPVVKQEEIPPDRTPLRLVA